MNIQPLIESLPAPMPGHVRVVRLEHKSVPTVGANCAPGRRTWDRLPTPVFDGFKVWEQMDNRVCGTYEHNFHTWFNPDEVSLIPGSEYRVVALDVPEEQASLLGHQVVFYRHQCHEVAVLVQ